MVSIISLCKAWSNEGRSHPYSPTMPNPHTSSPACWGALSVSLFGTSKMHFSVFPSIHTPNIFLSLYGGTLTPWRLPNIHGQCFHRVLRTAPIIFGNALARDVILEKGTLLQYVDDWLISTETKQDSDQNTVKILNFLVKKGIYLINQGSNLIAMGSIFRICFDLWGHRSEKSNWWLRSPTTKRQQQGFLRMTGFCHICIPNDGLKAKPLSEALKEEERESLHWNSNHQWL